MATENTTAEATTSPETAAAPKKPAAKKAPAKKPAAKKAPAKKPAAKKAASKTTPLRERDLKVLTVEAGYAAAGLADEAVAFAKELPAKAETLRTKLQEAVAPEAVKQQVIDLRNDAEALLSVEKVKETVAELRTNVEKQVKDLETQVKELRTEAPAKLKELKADKVVADAKDTFGNYRSMLTKQLDERVASFEKGFDTRVKAGKKVVTEVKANDQVKTVIDQAKTTTTKVKDAVAKVRKTADTTVDAAREQVEQVVESVKDLAS